MWRPHVRGCVVLCAAWVPDAGLRQVRHVVLSTVSTGRDVDGVVDSVLGTVTSLGERDVRFARYEACCMVCWAREYCTHARTAANSYRLVKAMRKCLSACAAPSVDAFVSRMLQASPEALLDADMAAVADAYMATPQYQQLRTDIVSQVRSSLLAAHASRLVTDG